LQGKEKKGRGRVKTGIKKKEKIPFLSTTKGREVDGKGGGQKSRTGKRRGLFVT